MKKTKCFFAMMVTLSCLISAVSANASALNISLDSSELETAVTEVYLKPVQVSEDTYEYYDEDGNLFCTWVAEVPLASETSPVPAARGSKNYISWTLKPQEYKHDTIDLDTRGAVVKVYSQIYCQGSTFSYVGFYTPRTSKYSWVEPPKSGDLSGYFQLASSDKINYAIKNDGKSLCAYSGAYWLE